ncbi:hypothetical protein ACJMK2_027011 [Sinanodonta woodiana]|uniref:Uncharacterized protein n=1 Tax=Sinanodonta woodiana TaxID=1069815 RepID=A0ABD3XMY9_SINWO
MTKKGDMLFGVPIIILQCISFGMVGVCLPLLIDPPESTKSFLPDTVCTTGSSFDQVLWMLRISSLLCSLAAFIITIQAIYRREEYSKIVPTSCIGICTVLAGLSCFMNIVIMAFIRWTLYKNGCEHPYDNFLEALIIVGVGAVCHIVSTLLFGIWRLKLRKSGSFFHDNIGDNSNEKSRLISIWTVPDYISVVNTLSYSPHLNATADQKSAVS